MDKEIQILHRLATYLYLCPSQLDRLGCNVSRKTLYKLLHRLREPKSWLINSRTFRGHPKYGALEQMHFLTPKGRRYLIDQCWRHPCTIKTPIGTSYFYQDYMHRKRTIDVHIALRAYFSQHWWAILLYDSYFEWKSQEQQEDRRQHSPYLPDI